MKTLIKHYVLPRGNDPRTILFGVFRGLRMHIDFSSQTQFLLGLAERETHRFLREAARTASWIVDVGAGAGELSLHFARQPNVSRVYAIEPSPKAFVQNLALHPSPIAAKIEIVSKFAGRRDNDHTMTLDALPVDRSMHGVIKIDVDGGEVDVLSGAVGLLTSGVADFLIETHSLQLEQECAALLKAKDYRTLIIDQAWWRWIIPEQRPIPHNRWMWATHHTGCPN